MKRNATPLVAQIAALAAMARVTVRNASVSACGVSPLGAVALADAATAGDEARECARRHGGTALRCSGSRNAHSRRAIIASNTAL